MQVPRKINQNFPLRLFRSFRCPKISLPATNKKKHRHIYKYKLNIYKKKEIFLVVFARFLFGSFWGPLSSGPMIYFPSNFCHFAQIYLMRCLLAPIVLQNDAAQQICGWRKRKNIFLCALLCSSNTRETSRNFSTQKRKQ